MTSPAAIAGARRSRRPTHTGGVIIGATFVLCAFAVVLLGLSPTLNPIDVLRGRGFDVDVPDLSGLTQTRALLDLQQNRLRGVVTFGYSNQIGRGEVMGQHPAAGTSAARGTSISVVVSRGPNRVPMPDLAGATEHDATTRLRALGLVPKFDRVNDDYAPKGTVFGQSPAKGIVLSGGTVVTLRVSLGPSRRDVPDVVGMPSEGAMFNLGLAGFNLGTVSTADSPTVAVGVVISTDPAKGTELDKDAAINVTVSSGPPPVEVPSVVGQQQASATATLAAKGLAVGEIDQLGAVADPLDGQVVGQTPSSGASLRPGEVVTLTIRRAAPPPTTTTTAPPVTVPPPAPPGGQ